MSLAEDARTLGLVLSPLQEAMLEGYETRLVEQNKTLNLTALRPDEIRRHLVLDALAGYFALPREGGIIDLGTGGGVPGLPLAVVAPHLRFTLVDAREKKLAFVAAAARDLGLANVTTRAARAEALGRDADFRERYEVGLAKALAPLNILVELLVPLLVPGGLLVAWKARAAGDEIAAAARALDELACVVEERRPYAIPGGDERRELILIRRTGPLPDRYPRRAGIPEKRPL